MTSPAEAVDRRGAGDSFTAATVAALATGGSLVDALRRGAAAGATNVARRGLASGRRDVIDALAELVTVEPFRDEIEETVG
jgi:1-phosphofructokinase